MALSSLKMLRIILLLSLLSGFVLCFHHLKTVRALEEKKQILQNQKAFKPAELSNEHSKTYGYADILDFLNFFPDIKVLKLDNSSGGLIFEVELKDDEEALNELISKLSEKGNFIGISRLQRYQKNSNLNVLNLTLEFAMN